MDRSSKLLILLLLVALAAAVVLAVQRADIEGKNRTVEIIVDADDVRQVAAAAGKPYAALLTQLQEAGATALAVREVTVGELIQSHRLVTRSVPGNTALYSPDASFISTVARGLRARLPQARLERIGTTSAYRIDLDIDQLSAVPVFLRQEDLRAARAADLRLVARPLNFASLTPKAVAAAVAEAASAGAEMVVFDEEEVLGYGGLLQDTARALQQHRMLYGFVEMAGQRGDASLVRDLPALLVRVHSISDADMLTMTPRIAVPRFARAVRERNIRACYVRLLMRAQPDPAGANARYLQRVAGAIIRQGYELGPPAPFIAPAGWPPTWLRGLLLLGLASGLVLLLRQFSPLAPRWAWAAFAITAGLGLVLGLMRSTLAAPLGGLAAACIFPALGPLAVLRRPPASGDRPRRGKVLGRALVGMVVASLVSVVGGLLIVGLYSRVSYLVGAGQFRGVKVAYVAPLVLIVAAVVANLPGKAKPRERWWTRFRLRVVEFLDSPVTVLQGLLVLAALAAVVVALMRSGNQPLVAPSMTELKLRDLMDSLLGVRPRTKEFLVGHPALMLAIALSIRGRWQWLPLLSLIAGIGQVSLLNSFCHLHTPLGVTLLRSFHGLWIGALIGTAVLLLWRLFCDQPPASNGS